MQTVSVSLSGVNYFRRDHLSCSLADWRTWATVCSPRGMSSDLRATRDITWRYTELISNTGLSSLPSPAEGRSP